MHINEPRTFSWMNREVNSSVFIVNIASTLVYRFPWTLGQVTQAPITKMRLLKMHALDWLNKSDRILRGGIQPI